MQWNIKRILWFIIGTVGFLGLIAFLDSLSPTKVSADSGSSTGYYGDVTYTCDACPELPRDCWDFDDRVVVLTYPDENPTDRSKPIIKTGSRSGAYSGLIPEEEGYWYLKGLGSACGSEYYLVYWQGLAGAVQQNINMRYNTEQQGPQN